MKNKTTILNIILVLFTIAVVLTAIFLPEVLLKKQADKKTAITTIAPEEYYLASATAIAIDASSKLTATDRINLISGAWESTFSECAISEAFLTEAEAVDLAKEQIEIFVENNSYPYSIKSSYKNWYSYETKVYSYKDATFNTYTAYLWEITFTKYDNSIIHTILITESGTILNARVNENNYEAKSLLLSYNNSNVDAIFSNPVATIDDEKTYASHSKIYGIYPNVDLSSATIINAYSIVVRESSAISENYIIYQYSTDTHYGIGIMPEQLLN